MEQNTFDRLQIAAWRQFASIDIEFHPKLTILTGANGAGKSTLLNLLSTHLGASRPYLGVPTRVSGNREFLSGIFSMPRRIIDWFKGPRPSDDPNVKVGELTYSDGTVAQITVPRRGALSYNVTIQNRRDVIGFHMPSHRLMPIYRPVPHLAFEGVDPKDAFDRLNHESIQGYLGGHTGSSTLFEIKNLIASWAALGPGNEFIEKNQSQLDAYTGFVEVLRKVLPRELGFEKLRVQPPDIVLNTRSGDFLIDAASGGVITIIEIAALIYACTLRGDVQDGRFVVTFDEPENHLHPALQRTLLPTLVDAFPRVQFVVATHSPFMVSSMKESNVYVLKYNDVDVEEEGARRSIANATRVESTKLDYVNRAGSAGEILRQVLGVPITYPEWVEAELAAIVTKYNHAVISQETIAALQYDVEAAGLEELFPNALAKLGNPQ